jgi:hypothetical protein
MNLQRIKQLAGIKLNESIEAVPTIGGSESDMQTAGTVGRDQAYAAYDASQTPATEELELGNDADTELGWYIIRAADGAIAAGPYTSSPHARRDAERKTWYLANRNNYDVVYGFDDNGYFVDADLNENTDNDEDDWAERLTREYEKNKGLEDGSEFDPKLDPQLDEKAPPGMEDMVLKLKKQYPGHPEKAFATAWSIYNMKHGKTDESTCIDESSPHRAIVQQCMARLQELSDSFVDEEKAYEIVEQELIEQGYDDEDVEYIKYAIDQEMNSDMHNDSDHSDDAYALASAGHGSDEDYGYYGGEDGMYEERDTSRLPQILKAEEINNLLTLPVDAAKAEAIELINKTNTKQEKKDYLIRQVESGLSSRAVVKLLYDMLLAGEGHRVQGSSYSRRFSEDFDLNNGYDDINDANGDDYFPDGADSPVVDTTGAAGARQGDNPEQKKMQIAELHKELVYGYRKFLNESATESKKTLNENQQLVSKITPIKFHGTVGVDTKNDTMDYADEITVRATVLDKNNKPVDIQYTINLNAEAEISWEDYDEPTGWNYGSDEPQHETFAGASVGNGDISDVDFVDDSFSINGQTGLSVEDVAQYINPESLQQLLNTNSYADIMEDKFTEEAQDLQPDEFDGHYD